MSHCRNNVTRFGIIFKDLHCEISVRQHYKVVIIISATNGRLHDFTCFKSIEEMLNKRYKNPTLGE